MSPELQLALQLHRAGNVAAALDHYAQAIALAPDDAAALYYGGVAAWSAGDAALAATRLDRLLATAANVTAEAHYHRGLARTALDRVDEAVADYRAAVRLKPGMAAAQVNLGNLLSKTGRHEDAEQAFRAAQASGADPIDTSYNRARNWIAAGRPDEARHLLETCLRQAPHHWQSRVALIQLLIDMAKPGEALVLARASARRFPSSLPVLNALGQAEEEAGEQMAALATYRKTFALAPADAALAMNLALLENENAEHDAALQTCATALAQGDSPGLRLRMATLLPVIPDSEEAIDAARQRFTAELAALRRDGIHLADPLREFGDTPFYLSYHGRDDDCRLLADLAETLRQAAPALEFRAPHCDRPRRPGKYRVGFCSHFLFDHSVGRAIHALVAALPRDEFEVHLFRLPPVIEDEMSRRIRADTVDHKLPPDLATARQRIAEAELDVLIYPEIGAEARTYYLAHGRLAPLQWNTNGHPCTSGLPEIDAYLSLDFLEPAGAERFYCESLIRLPGGTPFPAYPTTPLPDKPRSRQALGLPTEGELLICPQSLFKLMPVFDTTLAAILAARPSATLLLPESVLPGQKTALLRRLERTLGPLAKRIRFFPRRGRAEFIELINACDLLLDPFPVGGGITTWDALITGTPIVTLPGQLMRSRYTALALTEAGIEGTIAGDAAHYAGIARDLLLDADARMQLRSRLREAAPAILADTRTADHFLAAIRAALGSVPS